MTLSGPEALRALDDALRDIRREEDEIVHKFGRSGERIAKIRATEGDLLRQFSNGRISAEAETEFGGGIIKAGIAARQALKLRSMEMRGVAERLNGLEARLGELVAARNSALDEIDRHQIALRALSSRIAAAITRDPEYERRQRVARELKSIATEARAKARQADADREIKGRPYRADRLFMYLFELSYGTEGYKAGPLTRRLDGELAKFIGFTSAREHYSMLNDLPTLLHAHAEAARARASAAEDDMDDIERAAIDAAGGGAVQEALAAAQTQIEAIDAEIVTIQDERDATIEAYVRLAEANDQGFERAVDALAQALGSANLQTLVTEARQLQPDTDDPLVSQLNDAHLRIVEEQTDTRDEQVRLRTLAARRRELEDIEYEFKALKFDDPRSLFRDDDLAAGQLGSFLTGATTAPSYWAAWRRSQNWSVGTSDWGGGVGLPRHGRQAGTGVATEPDAFSRPRAASAGAES